MGTTLLIVDGERDFGKTFAQALGRTATVLLANSEDPSRDALRLLQERPEITHVLVDLNMPDLRGDRNEEAGLELIDAIRQTIGRPVRLMINTGPGLAEGIEPKARSRDVPMRGRDDPPEDLIAWLAEEPPRRMIHHPTEAERRLDETFHWLHTDPAVRREHGGRFVAASGRRVWAWAEEAAALLTAVRATGGPPRSELVFSRVPYFTASESEEFGWCLADVQYETAKGYVIAVNGRTLYGYGPDRATALADALANPACPAEGQLTFLLLL